MVAKNSILGLALKALLLSIVLKLANCIESGCRMDQNLTDSTVYALQVTKETPFRAAGKDNANIIELEKILQCLFLFASSESIFQDLHTRCESSWS